MTANKPFKVYPCYSNPDAWDLDEICDVIHNGLIEEFIFTMVQKKAEFPLQRFSMPVTKPVHGLTLDILVDLNELDGEEDLYRMRVKDNTSLGDNDVDVKTDIASLQIIIDAIKNNKPGYCQWVLSLGIVNR